MLAEPMDNIPYDNAAQLAKAGIKVALMETDTHNDGSLTPGKVANMVVWSRDPFEFQTAVEHVFIRGPEIPLVSRQTELFDR